LVIIEPSVFRDHRGWFVESYSIEKFEKLNLKVSFLQDNHSLSLSKGVLRGLHFQNNPKPQAKLVRCTHGKIYDVAVDLRKSSPTYLKWFGIELTKDNHLMLLIPHGFAHGFLTLEDNCEVQYKVDNYYDKSLDHSIHYKDPILGINWPLKDVILSDKDMNAPLLKDSDFNFR
jgi:dTDP-4-dehydrorhamnose reductase/dTDP-4-dehydrorhamnose 3,5-epimerase